MRIGMVTACYYPVVNGVTRMISLYKKELEDRGHEVTVFTIGHPASVGDEPGVVRSVGIPLGETGYFIGIRYSRMAQKLLREMDILHCHHLFMSVEMARRYASCPIIFTNHTRYDLYTGAYTPLPQPAAEVIMRQVWPQLTNLCDLVIAPSPSIRRLLEEFGVRSPMVVIENGIDLIPFSGSVRPIPRSKLGLDEGGCNLVYVGRLSAEKNLVGLLKQFTRAHEEVSGLSLLVVGDGPQMDRLQRLSYRLGIEQQVCLAGHVAHDELPAYLAAADIFVTASTSEVHPLSVIEAMASGLPVIGTLSPGIADIVEHRVTGLLARPPESDLAAAMVALARDPAQRAQMGAAGRAASQRFDIRRTTSLTLSQYERLLDSAKNRHDGVRASQPLLSALGPVVEQLGRMLRPTRYSRSDHDQ
jgi:1,2-diacylglycerol 3-alpha-glucosyltransferase